MPQLHHDDTAIVTRDLSRTYRSRGNKNLLTGLFRPEWRYTPAVQDLSFDIKRGEAVAFLGPNGAGKTTTMKMLSGLMHPSSGDVSVLGYTPFERKQEYLKRIGFVMGNKTGLNWDLTPTQNFDLLQKIYDVPLADFNERLQRFVTMLKIEHVLDSQTRQLSLGERLKCEFAAALLHEPEVLFLDEPTIGLDIDSKAELRKFLRQLVDSHNITMLLTSHDMDDIGQTCERAIIINHGQKLYDGSLKSLRQKYSDKKYVQLVFRSKPSAKVLAGIGTVTHQNSLTYHLVLESEQGMKNIARLLGDDELLDMQIEAVPLEEIISNSFKQ